MRESIPYSEEPKQCLIRKLANSPFVELTDGVEFDVKMQYPILLLENAEKQCFVRKEVKERLLEAQSKLPGGILIRIWDAWRPFALQEELYDKYSRKLIEQFCLEKYGEEERKRYIRQYISEPHKDEIMVPVHTTGGAVDVTLVREDGTELNMGTSFDSFSEKAHTYYYEKGEEKEIQKNRRMLYHAMCSSGFTNLPSEWWHYDYGDRFWAYYSGNAVMYEGVFTKERIYF